MIRGDFFHVCMKKFIASTALTLSFLSPNAYSQRVSTPFLGSKLNTTTRELLKRQIVGVETPAGTGTGVIIGKKGDTYTAITSKHVIPNFNPAEGLEAYSMIHNSYYPILNVEYPTNNSEDIMIFQFQSSDQHSIATLNFLVGESCISNNRSAISKQWSSCHDNIKVAGISMPSGSITSPVYRFIESSLQERVVGNKDGFEFIYSASTVPGMSGGPIVVARKACDTDVFYAVVAIHGRSEDYISGGRSGISLGVPVDLISNYLKSNSNRFGIPNNELSLSKLNNMQLCHPDYLQYRDNMSKAAKRLESKKVTTDFNRLCKIAPTLEKCKK